MRYIGALAALVVVAVVSGSAGYALGLSKHHGVQAEWLYDYQTLLTGLCAITAAFLTIAVMIFVDRRQGHRHNQVLALNLRKDRLMVERAVPYGVKLISLSQRIPVVMRELHESKKSHEQFSKRIDLLRGIGKEANRLLNSVHLDRANELFDERLYELLRQCKSNFHDDWSNCVNSTWGVFNEGAIHDGLDPKDASRQIHQMGMQIKELAFGIEQLAEKYGRQPSLV